MSQEELWSKMDECLADLQEGGYEEMVPMEGGAPKSGRAMCHDLIDHYNWVESKVLEDGQVEYRLTSDAIEALDTVERLRTTSTVMTGSRMRTILDQIDRTYLRLSPDYGTRLHLLEQRVADALDELDRYEASGGALDLSTGEALDEIENLIDLMGGLPHDLRRLEEDIRANAGQLIGRFRTDDRPTGQIIGEYIQTGRRLLEETDHGRSFKDSLAVIGDASLAGTIDDKLDAIAESPVLEDAGWESARRIQDSWNQVASGIVWVNRENSRSSHAINRSITRHDVTRDRELTAVLKELEGAAYAWAATVGPREEGPFLPAIGKLEAKAVRDKPYTPSDSAPPPPLDQDDERGAPLSLEDLRRMGGPMTQRILDAVAETLAFGARTVNLAKAFSALPADLRRPVELTGLVQQATTLGAIQAGTPRARYACVDLDGNDVIWEGPQIILSVAQLDESRGKRQTESKSKGETS